MPNGVHAALKRMLCNLVCDCASWVQNEVIVMCC